MSECVEFALRRCGLRHSLTLKPEQLKSVEVVLAGSHVIAVLPTGFGKSLIYQLLPFAFDLQTDSTWPGIVTGPRSPHLSAYLHMLHNHVACKLRGCRSRVRVHACGVHGVNRERCVASSLHV